MKCDWLENDKSQNSLNSGTDLIRIKTDVLFGTKLKYIYDKSTSPKADFRLAETNKSAPPPNFHTLMYGPYIFEKTSKAQSRTNLSTFLF